MPGGLPDLTDTLAVPSDIGFLLQEPPDIVEVCPRNKIRKLGKYVLLSVLLLHFYNVWKSFNLNFCFLLKKYLE